MEVFGAMAWGSPVGLAIFFSGVGVFFWGFSRFLAVTNKGKEK